jgi:hypothetical protein
MNCTLHPQDEAGVFQIAVFFIFAPSANFKVQSLSGCKALTISAM